MNNKWIEEFDENVENANSWSGSPFGIIEETWDGENEGVEFCVDWNGIKDFIKNLLQSQLKELREEIEKSYAHTVGLRYPDEMHCSCLEVHKEHILEIIDKKLYEQ